MRMSNLCIINRLCDSIWNGIPLYPSNSCDTSPILGERILAITLTQQRKQWLSVELNRWRSEIIHYYFLNNKKQNINNYNVNMHDYYN